MRAIGGNPHVRLFRPLSDRNEFAALLASADALLHGCESETFGMAAAEARASGVPVIVPDLGGAADFARNSGGISYRAASRIDLVRAIMDLPERFEPVRDVPDARSMNDHFEALFALYASLASQRLRRAA
jgi:alpha-1,6-mannosyltransferase